MPIYCTQLLWQCCYTELDLSINERKGLPRRWSETISRSRIFATVASNTRLLAPQLFALFVYGYGRSLDAHQKSSYSTVV